jgi:hypothetical protein
MIQLCFFIIIVMAMKLLALSETRGLQILIPGFSKNC